MIHHHGFVVSDGAGIGAGSGMEFSQWKVVALVHVAGVFFEDILAVVTGGGE